MAQRLNEAPQSEEFRAVVVASLTTMSPRYTLGPRPFSDAEFLLSRGNLPQRGGARHQRLQLAGQRGRDVYPRDNGNVISHMKRSSAEMWLGATSTNKTHGCPIAGLPQDNARPRYPCLPNGSARRLSVARERG